MRIRFHNDERKKLRKLSTVADLDQAVVIRKFLTKFKRMSSEHKSVYVAVKNISLPATYSSRRKKNSESIEVEIPEILRDGLNALMIRKVVTWGLDMYKIKRQKLSPGCGTIRVIAYK